MSALSCAVLDPAQHGVSDVIVQAYGDINADQNVIPPMNGFIKNHREDHGAPNQGADVMRYVDAPNHQNPPHPTRPRPHPHPALACPLSIL